jgi:Protein of unknown function (DUF726)
VWDPLVMSLTGGCYDARIRVALHELSLQLGFQKLRLLAAEHALATSMRAVGDASGARDEHLTSSVDEDALSATASSGRWWKVGVGAAVGGGIFVLTSGLAAPLVLPLLGSALATATTAGVAAGAATVVAPVSAIGTSVLATHGTVAVGALFGAAGASIAGGKMSALTGGLEQFEFRSLSRSEGLSVYIGVSGFQLSEDAEDADLLLWANLSRQSRDFAQHLLLRWDVRQQCAIGDSLESFVSSTIAGEATKYWLRHMSVTVAAASSAFSWPLSLMPLVSVIDNPWSMGKDRALKAGRFLAATLRDRVHGYRPVSLVGFSCGALLIYECLRQLAAWKLGGVCR